ncbi:MAG: (2Fe-2S)-binding protein [Acidiferrobacterales bacterium]|nr:(2Fe-2S)-binding protein [Acidiferrobacterales bacterium]
MEVNLHLNGQTYPVEAVEGKPLLWVIRDDLKLTGTKYGCGVAFCGACTVLVDGQPVRSCQTYLNSLEGREVTTIEGLDSEVAAAVQKAWIELNVVQCGYCQSGQILSAVGLLSRTPAPTTDEIDRHMWGNVCRCATYQRIRSAVQRASQILQGG